jgi:hypothetical protein
MICRAWILLAAVLVSPAWSQTFDLHSPSLQKIVRDTAATQFAPVRLVEETPSKRKPPLEAVTFAAAKDSTPIQHAPVLRPPAPAPRRDGILSGLIDALLERDDDLDLDGKYAAKSFCLASNADKTSVQRDQACGR